jgi:hypothetical protein
MEIQDIRRARLAQLIREKYDGSQAKFVEETGEAQSEISGLLNKKSFGEKKARKLEVKCDLPAGWLDRLDEQLPQTQLSRVRPTLTVVESVEPQWMALAYVTQRELEVLTHYRRASDIGKSLIETAAESADNEESGAGTAHQS